MDANKPETLMHDVFIKEYLELLHNKGIQAQEPEELINMIDKLEEQFTDILTELKEVKSSIASLQNPQTKSILKNSIDKIENVVMIAKQDLTHLKGFVINTAKEAISQFKTIGVKGLVKSLDILQIEPLLKRVRNALFYSTKELNGVIRNVDQMSNELKRIKHHAGNFKHVMFGQGSKRYVADKSKLNVIQCLLRAVKLKEEKMIFKTSDAIKRIESIKKTSVKKDIKILSSKSQKVKSAKIKGKEISI